MNRLYRIVDPRGSLEERERKQLLLALALLIPFAFAPFLVALQTQLVFLGAMSYIPALIALPLVVSVNQTVSNRSRIWSHPKPIDWLVIGVLGAIEAGTFSNPKHDIPALFVFLHGCYVYLVAAEALSVSRYVMAVKSGRPTLHPRQPKNAFAARIVAIFDPHFVFPQPFLGWSMLLPLTAIVAAVSFIYFFSNNPGSLLFMSTLLWFHGALFGFSLSNYVLLASRPQPRPDNALIKKLLAILAVCLIFALTVGLLTRSFSSTFGCLYIFTGLIAVAGGRVRSEIMAKQGIASPNLTSPII